MIIFAGPKLKFRPQKMGIAPKFSSDIRSAAGELFIGPHQSLPEMSDGYWGTLQFQSVIPKSGPNLTWAEMGCPVRKCCMKHSTITIKFTYIAHVNMWSLQSPVNYGLQVINSETFSKEKKT